MRIKVEDKNDSPPSFKDVPLIFSISEDLSAGQSVATLTAVDPDTLGQLEYTLISGDDNHFALDKYTGVLSLVDSLDRETKDVYKLTVRASDGIQHTDTLVTVQVRYILSLIKSMCYFYFVLIVLFFILFICYIHFRIGG